VFWNLRQLAGTFTLAAAPEALAEALNGFAPLYRAALAAAMLRRLGLKQRGDDADVELVNAGFKAIAEGGEALRWEPFFFDWFGGLASEARALAGPRAGLYGGEAFTQFRRLLGGHEAERPERLQAAYFAGPEPEELLYDQIEALWAPIAESDDWSAFEAKLAGIERARHALSVIEN
jgi:uncharacterized protein YdiU (UPF0061 family)